VFKSGYYAASAGFSPDHPDMRQIAPTVAQLMGVRLPSSKASPLRVSR
jgi:hypothetical protein